MSRWVVLEGGDGCGKSEQARRLATRLREGGREVVHLREPGSTPVGEALRRLLLDRGSGEMSSLTEALLFTAARCEMVRAEVAPALRRGAVVVAERSFLSTLVYQGVAAEQPVAPALLLAMTRAALGELQPGLMLVLDVDPGQAAARCHDRVKDRIEARAPEFAMRVRDGFRTVAESWPQACLIDASGSAEEVEQAVWAALRARLPEAAA